MRAGTEKDATAGVITRRFGLTPVAQCPACQTECQKIKERTRKTTTPRYVCPTCAHEIATPVKTALPPDFFQKIAKATNAFIQAGIAFPCPPTVYVRLTIAPRRALDFQLNTPDRFLQFLSDGWTWQKPVLSKSAKGTLVLAIPFARSAPEVPPSEPNGTRDRLLSVDLGLKTLATLSVVEGVTPLEVDCPTFTPQEYRALFHDQNIGQAELARYFLDQPQLAAPAREWFQVSPKAAPSTNLKRKLYHLQQEARRLRSLLTQYRNRHRPTYNQKVKYQRLRRTWKRVWRQLKALHTELARQLALRILAVAQHHQVGRIRFEDLSWARHSPKAASGYWLATWQVHWFYAQIQARVAEGAARLGIPVDWVNPRETSQRCSRCGQLGQRPNNGKVFRCPPCGFQLDSDLNAARNLHLVPSSPVAIRDRARAPVAALH